VFARKIQSTPFIVKNYIWKQVWLYLNVIKNQEKISNKLIQIYVKWQNGKYAIFLINSLFNMDFHNKNFPIQNFFLFWTQQF